jgi:hypothetical protein
MRKNLLATAQIAKFNELTVSEVTELSSSTFHETALARLRGQGSRGIPIVSSHREFTFTMHIFSIMTELTEETLKTDSKRLSNCRISRRHLVSLPHVRFCFGSYSMEHDIKPVATTVIQCITMRVGVAIRQLPGQYLTEGIHPNSECNYDAIAIKKQRKFVFRRMDIDEQISNNVGECLLY